MKQLLLLGTATLAFTFIAVAHGGTNSANGQADASETKGTTHDEVNAKLTGCLTTSEKGEGFVLMDSKRSVEVQSAQNLGPYTGHQVNLEGTWQKSDTGNTKGGKEGGTKGRRLFTATKIENISDSCPNHRPR